MDFALGGILVEGLDNSFARAARDFQQFADLRVKSAVRVGGHSGYEFSAKPGTTVPLSDLPGQLGGELQPVDPNLILLRWAARRCSFGAFDDVAERAEVNRVLMSFRFAP